MTGDALPSCSSCVHNLHRVGDGRHPRPEPTDLCRNALGVFHMLDCPLEVGLACSYYEAAESPHPVTSDADLEAAREEMHAEFLGWRYRRRVRWLTKPKNVVPVGIVVEGPPEAEEVVPEALAMRERPPEAVAVAAAAGTETPADGSAPAAPAAPAAPERYPGQRRSEERLAKKRARLAALDAAAAAKAAQIAVVNQSPPPADDGDDDEFDDDGDEEAGDDEFGADLADEEPVDTGPKTVEQVLAALPDAPMVGSEPRRQGGPPRGDGQPRHRRRRGRRGRGPGAGPGQGPGPGQGQGRGPGQGPGPRPGGQRGPQGQRGPRGPRGPRGGGGGGGGGGRGGGGPPGGGAPTS